MTATYKKWRTVLTRDAEFFLTGVFESFPDDDGLDVYMKYEDWKALGSPHEITVTIRPGDHLD